MDLEAFNPFSPQFEAYQIPASSTSFTQLITHKDNDTLIPPLIQQHQQDNLLDDNDLLLQIPAYFTESADLFLRNEDDTTAQLRKKASPLHLDHENNETSPKKNDGKKKQKVVHHREIERQRPSEMSALHASLRSLLPLEYIKGKRAMSDHLGEAVKYINHLQQNLKALDDERNTLKKEVCISNKNSKIDDNRDFTVKLCKGGVDVTLSISRCRVEGDDDENVDCGDEGRLPLSKVFQCLIQEGLDVVSCISQRVEGSTSKLVHSIHAQVEDGINDIAIDAVKLQQKLKDL